MTLQFQVQTYQSRTQAGILFLCNTSFAPLSVVSWLTRREVDPLPLEQIVRKPDFMITRILCHSRFEDINSEVRCVENGLSYMNDLEQKLPYLAEEPTYYRNLDLVVDVYRTYHKYQHEYYIPIATTIQETQTRTLETLRKTAARTIEDGNISLLVRLLADETAYNESVRNAHEVLSDTLDRTMQLLQPFFGHKYGNITKPPVPQGPTR